MAETYCGYELHPLVTLWRTMTKDEFQVTKESIKEIGQVDSVVLADGKIVEGRNRAIIVQLLNEEDPSRTRTLDTIDFEDRYPGMELPAFLRAKNDCRRHQPSTPKEVFARYQEAQLKMKEEAIKRQRMGGLAPIGAKGKTAEHVAVALGESTRQVQRMATVAAAPNASELVAKVDAGEMSWDTASTAARVATGKKKPATKPKKKLPEPTSLNRWNMEYDEVREAIVHLVGPALEDVVNGVEPFTPDDLDDLKSALESMQALFGEALETLRGDAPVITPAEAPDATP
jgi:hypothetical protein